jgi:hypothetical protein
MSKNKRGLRTLDQNQLQDVNGGAAGIGGFGPGGFRLNNGQRAANNNNGGFNFGSLIEGFFQSNAGQNFINNIFGKLFGN